ncbi:MULTISPECIES: aryl-sulfate sulfotransferase [unclassified Haladaptatus]|uniref:aryl-sulfate sulfotransferase n=1 Tax=unclassified Haladaptatus TaxID=2622732 RepID=UPI00209C5917|nr:MULTISPECIES: aryl-sulfate sulfotransferase [unclassified Haladaptatus]MCO8245591.1 aryl-sulfate sulfotransferase [Haladaptatus sp. AB643]MCO8255419.1 aryl-sulfate sulfotransferase [Haladaptatus sp. AB618]
MDLTERLPPRAWLTRGIVLLVVVALLTPSVVSAITYDPSVSNLKPGTIDQPANGTTIISVQGFNFQGEGNRKKPARLVSVGPKGNINWVYNGSKEGVSWFYDVDPLPNGNLLVVSTQRGKTVVYEMNPETKKKVWSRTLPIKDTHDIDLINNGTELLVGNLRNYNSSTGENNDRVYVYSLEKDKIVWQWHFTNYYDKNQGGEFTGDWTHLNNVQQIAPGKFAVDPRNMDQVLVIDRKTKKVTMKLGEPGNTSILNKQHNPDYLESESGKPTFLVADSENNRIVEYEKDGNDWNRTWTLGSSDTLTWPRDADRLPNGNTLVVDSSDHRVIEVTPEGKIVWEFYAPWLPYDAERIGTGDESNGPTIADQNASGTYQISGSANLDPGTGKSLRMSVFLGHAFAGTSMQDTMRHYGERWDQVTPFIRPIWMSEYAFIAVIFAILLLVLWLLGELVYQRKRISNGLKYRLG